MSHVGNLASKTLKFSGTNLLPPAVTRSRQPLPPPTLESCPGVVTGHRKKTVWWRATAQAVVLQMSWRSPLHPEQVLKGIRRRWKKEPPVHQFHQGHACLWIVTFEECSVHPILHLHAPQAPSASCGSDFGGRVLPPPCMREVRRLPAALFVLQCPPPPRSRLATVVFACAVVCHGCAAGWLFSKACNTLQPLMTGHDHS